jgi:hypothetical protein
MSSDGASQETICASIMLGNPQFRASACGTTIAPALEISTNVLLNTDQGTSGVPGISCAVVANLSSHVCALVAGSIVVKPGATLAARGTNPLALFAHAITIQGTVDVASHVGAGSYRLGCNAGSPPAGGGGGGGGASADNGGGGGDEGGVAGSGGTGGSSFGIDTLIGGCAGSSGGRGIAGDGGAGGGSVWIATDTGALIFDSTAVVNASGAGGAGGATQGHGGSGGGSGGLIVLQAQTLQRAQGAEIFANGGGGGGGAGTNAGPVDNTHGSAGGDPLGPNLGGGGGTGGLDGTGSFLAGTTSGNGGYGFPSTIPIKGQDGGSAGRGGGGGGGGQGAIRVVSPMHIDGPNVSPPPVYLQ